MRVQSNMYVNYPEIVKDNIKKRGDVSHNTISEDDITISDSAKKLATTARNKGSDFCAMRFSSVNEKIREIPAEYKCENLFKLELRAMSVSENERNIFEGHSENHVAVFGQWIDDNAEGYLSEDEVKNLKDQIETMVSEIDKLNAQEGYRGTSFESVFLLGASEAGLKKLNEMYVPEQQQAGFAEMIDEYVHFNASARNSIMERMTPDYMVVGIEKGLYKYKTEIVSDEQTFYQKEQAEVSDLCNRFLEGKMDKSSFYNEIKGYLSDYYGNRYEMRNQPEAVEGKVNDMLGKLQRMYFLEVI